MKKLTNFFSFVILCTFISTTTHGASIPDGTDTFFKTWNLSAEVVAGVQQSPDASMTGDQLIINADNTITVKFMGVELTGTYVLVGGNSWLSISLSDGSSLRLKIISITETSLQVEHINPESVHRVFVFTAV